MTFSIVARCERTGMFGVAVTSSSPAVAARCAFACANVGAVATQNITDPRLGPQLLDQLAVGDTAESALSNLRDSTPNLDFRQLLCIGRNGDTAVFSGTKILGTWSEKTSQNAAAAGNLLANEHVPAAMITSFHESNHKNKHLSDRLIEALFTGLHAGGEAGPVHSAGLLVVDDVDWPIVDLRIDWSDSCPVQELSNLWRLYQPQMNDYVTRALNPSAAPSYGVPGDE